jgi:hypothetical protein
MVVSSGNGNARSVLHKATNIKIVVYWHSHHMSKFTSNPKILVSRLYEGRRHFEITEQLLASQKGFYSMHVVGECEHFSGIIQYKWSTSLHT